VIKLLDGFLKIEKAEFENYFKECLTIYFNSLQDFKGEKWTSNNERMELLKDFQRSVRGFNKEKELCSRIEELKEHFGKEKVILSTFDKTSSNIDFDNFKLKCLLPDPDIMFNEAKKYSEKATSTTKLNEKKLTTANSLAIVSLVQFKNSNFLFTSDARGEHIYNALREKQYEGLKLDYMDVPHHGSLKNNFPMLYKDFPCSEYFLSSTGNESHGFPAKVVIDALKDCKVAFPGKEWSAKKEYQADSIYVSENIKNITMGMSHLCIMVEPNTTSQDIEV
jgi:hypothetical protein